MTAHAPRPGDYTGRGRWSKITELDGHTRIERSLTVPDGDPIPMSRALVEGLLSDAGFVEADQ